MKVQNTAMICFNKSSAQSEKLTQLLQCFMRALSLTADDGDNVNAAADDDDDDNNIRFYFSHYPKLR